MEKKKIYLSDKDKIIAGVCGGIAEYFDRDANLIRLIAVVVAIVSHVVPFIIFYIAAAFLLPKRPSASATV
ncbi:MAG: PspC domain-containing protein [Patescibacteria group bacterium]